VGAEDDERAKDLARYYDLDLDGHSEDVDLYLALAGRRHQRVLELACGTGRIAIPLAAAGHDVIGVDHDPAMLERARAAWVPPPRSANDGRAAGSLELIEADLTTLNLERRFDLVILALNALPMLPGRAAQLAALRVAASHLEPDGRAVIDVWLAAPEDLVAYDGSLELAWQRRDPDTGDELSKAWAADYDAATATATITTFFDSWPTAGGPLRRVARRDELHLIGATELELLAGQAGLAVQTAGGDYQMSPLGPGSERVVLVCGLL